jgi:glycosyltransferase involved in cell wall biosynthesis
MSRGIPVVSTAVGGIPELITPRKNGLLVPAADVQALTDAAMQVHDDAYLARHLSAEGRALACRFTVDSLVVGMEDVYRILTARRSGSERALKKAG